MVTTTILTVDHDDFADVDARAVPEHQPGGLWLGQGQGQGWCSGQG